MTPYHEAIKSVLERYTAIQTYRPNLDSFIQEAIRGCDEGMPICKLNRWLGYIQGVLITDGHLTVEEERDATRRLFRPLDYPPVTKLGGEKGYD